MNVSHKCLIFTMLFLALSSIFNVSIAAETDIELFARESCPHCLDAKIFLTQLQQEQPNLKISVHDIEHDSTALTRLRILAQQQNVVARVPAFYIDGKLIVGYTDDMTTGQWIRNVLVQKIAPPQIQQNDVGSCEIQSTTACEPTSNKNSESFELNFFGQKITLSEIGLPFFTLAMGLLDGFNPCSMWVLILMISLLAPMHNRRRMLVIVGTFVAIEGIVYFLFMTAWLNLFLWVGLSRISEIIIALIALFAGLINVKDFLFFGRGLTLSIPSASKAGIYVRIRKILNAQNLVGTLIGVTILALLVQAVEFMCTSGFPALYTRILTLQHLNNVGYYGYLLLYNVAYMFDDFVVLGIGVVTLSRYRLQEKEGHWLKLISGLVMVGLGVYLLV